MTWTRPGIRLWPMVIVLALSTAGACSSSAVDPPGAATDQSTAVTASTSATNPTASASAEATPTPAAIERAYGFADGTTVGVLAAPWSAAGRVDGELIQMLPKGLGGEDEVWADIIAYQPTVAFASGTTESVEVPDDPVEWTLAHPDLEILDERQVIVDGVTATQIDARAKSPTNWLAVQERADEWSGTERVVLVPTRDSWLVLRASTFDPERAFVAVPPSGDAFVTVLESIDLAG